MDAEVGIIFMRGDDLWIDSTPVNAAVDYGDLKTHEKGHPDYWEQLQESHSVPRVEEYDETPRGRATFNARKSIYYLFLVQCIKRTPRDYRQDFPGFAVAAKSRDGDSRRFPLHLSGVPAEARTPRR